MSWKIIIPTVIAAVIIVGTLTYITTSKIPIGGFPTKPTEVKELCAEVRLYKVCINYTVTYENGVKYVIIKDAANRTLKIKVPVKRIVIAFYPQIYVALLGTEWTKYVVGWRAASWKQYRYDYYVVFVEKYPKIENIPDVGNLYRGTFDIDKTIGLNPDVVFADIGQYRFYEDVLKKVEDAGIPVVFIDHGKTMLGPVRGILTLGVLFEKEDRAKELAEWILDKLSLVFERIERVEGGVKVFLERGYRLWYTQGRYGWGEILAELKAVNIAEGKVARIGEIDPEYVISQDPEIWIITCSWWIKRPETPLCGVCISNETQVIERAVKFIKMHEGMESTKAVREGNVWLIYHDLDHNFNFLGYLLLAKILYPDLFSDVDTDAIVKEFFSRFMGVEFTGIWMMHLDKTTLTRYGVLS